MSAKVLLARAKHLYDDPAMPFARYANQQAWRTGFSSGADWMRLVLSHLRDQSIASISQPFQVLGIIKYGLASLGALLYVLLIWKINGWLLLPGFVVVFYAIEAQMVFLFPLAIDGEPRPLASSPRWTAQAGGTANVMWTVMQLAVLMIFGGFLGQGFIRSWALGCLAVVLWYEEVRIASAS